MKKESGRSMWQMPWGYPESAAVVGGVVAVGIILQLTTGSFDFYLLAKPVNLLAAAVLFLLCVRMGFARRNAFVKWLTGVPMSVSVMMCLLLLAVIMGFTPQAAGGRESASLLGADAMTRSWPFVLTYFLMLLSLGGVIARRFSVFRRRDYPFYLNHLGLWLLLVSSGLGYADMERYVMYVQEGQTEWRVYDEEKQVKELPVAIQLNDFDMDVYPPGLAVIDRNTGEVQPAGKPVYFQIDPGDPAGRIGEWNIEVKEYIHQAVRNSDSTYHSVPMPGAAPAVRVSAIKEGVTTEGWVCAGNQAQMYMALPLTARYSLVMTVPEPRSFTSDIEVYTQDGKVRKALLEVNKPLRIGAWTIYQYGYDNNAGRLSAYSSFELVYDPWLIPVYVGILCMMLGSVCMLWAGRDKKEVPDDLE